jgi:hypothetical protein
MESPSSCISGIGSKIDREMNSFGAMRCVAFPRQHATALHCLLKIEYMVVSLDNAEKNAKLSLRQTEILAKLSTIVGNICADCPEE